MLACRRLSLRCAGCLLGYSHRPAAASGSSNISAPASDPTAADRHSFSSTGTDRENYGNERETLWKRATALVATTSAELRAEVERDARDGVAAVPPLPPPGWKVRHSPGSNFFSMTQVLKNGSQSSVFRARRYRSVHDTFMQTVGEQFHRRIKGNEGGNSNVVSCKDNRAQDSKTTREDGGFCAKMSVDYKQDKVDCHAKLHPVGGADHCSRVNRADIHLTIFAPFLVYDPSIHDSTVDICEWSSFDLIIQKTKPTNANGKEDPGLLSHLAEESALCMYVRLASVNSEMRIRSIQLLSMQEAQALTDHACLGQGEPLLLELLQRRPLRHSAAEKHRDEALICLSEAVAGSLRVVEDQVAHEKLCGADGVAVACSSSSHGSYYPAYEMILDPNSLAGKYSRTLCYGGPYMRELSREMQESLIEYIQGDLGVSSQLCEYVCQMQYFLEQEEYMTWLGRVQHMAQSVARRD
uniref:Uncharacterized protein TCIL3000_11_3620 n=1 Tax=Trypanosoma congolense (strain IL3000) TaxID=1068625 RepID=G0UZZ3_TRYCI|nr:unnamed protein product [Trypanosoma congolense IL3000]